MAKLNRRTFLGTAAAGVVASAAVLNLVPLNLVPTISLQVYGSVGHGPEAIWKEFPLAEVKEISLGQVRGDVQPNRYFAGIAEDGMVWVYRSPRPRG